LFKTRRNVYKEQETLGENRPKKHSTYPEQIERFGAQQHAAPGNSLGNKRG
jgi:hypothetical protein